MRIGLYTTKNSITSNKYKTNPQKTKQQDLQNNSSKQFMPSNSSYGKAIAFGSKKFVSAGDFEIMKAGLVDFVEHECKPFLAKAQPFSDKNHQIHNIADEMTSLYHKKVICGQSDFKIFDAEIPQGYKKVAEYLKNKEEYNYLKEKSKKEFVSDETRQYALNIASIFNPEPVIEHYSPVITKLKNIEKTIKNGIAGLKAMQKSSKIAQKRDNLHEAESLTLFNQHFIGNVSVFNRNATESLEKSAKNDDYYVTRVVKLFEQIPEIKESIVKHNEMLPKLTERTQNAEKLLEENSFTEEDVQKAIDASNLKRQGIFDRNMKNFYQSLETQTQYKWDDNLNVQTDEILQKQSDANKKLWDLIEADKKKYFSEEEVAKRQAKANEEYQQWLNENNPTHEDLNDLPF